MREAPKIERAISHYNSLVEKYVDELPSIVGEMSRHCVESKLTFGGRPMFNVLRPNFLTVRQYEYFSTVCRQLRNAIVKFKNRALQDESVMAQMGLIPEERGLVDIDPGYDRLSISARWDSFLAGDDLKFVELNAECPAGIAYQEVAADIYRELPFVKDFAGKYRIMRHTIRQTLLKELLDTYKTWRGFKSGKKPVIAIVDWRDVPTYTEFQLFEEFFRQKGYESLISDPRDLSFDGKRLSSNGKKIDIVYKRVLTNDCVERPDDTRALVDAYRTHNVCMINPFRAKIVHKKAIFAALTHEKNSSFFTKTELNFIQRHIPWTRMLVFEKTMFEGRRIDLVDFVSRNKNLFVLKPNDEYGGKGVTLGLETSEEVWENRLEEAVQEGNFIIQRIVTIPKSAFPVLVEGHLKYTDLVVDLDPYVFGPKVEGVLTRLSASSLANVTAGGGTTPTFVIDEKSAPRLKRQVKARTRTTKRKKK